MPNEDEPTCSLLCEIERQEREERETNTINNSKIDEGNIRIKEIINFLRDQGYTSLDLLDELESLIAAKTQTVRN
ncbi:hypothetical protein AAGG74_18625 [Bacillus mexicanus]|uniref:hypothetical protein n=1 Tax=Bacillus mexicanus TaxID=2834415 RepID=UPI003D1ED4D7